MTWVVTDYSPPKRIQYTVFQPDSHTWTLRIDLAPLPAGQCQLIWQHTFTGLTDAGNRSLAGYTEEKHRSHLAQIDRCLVHYLTTGAMIRADETRDGAGEDT
jgi:hypothetical protein